MNNEPILKVKDISLYEDKFSYIENKFKYDRVQRLYFLTQSVSINYIRASKTAKMKIDIESFGIITIDNDLLPGLFPSGKLFKLINKAYTILQKLTLPSRASYYLNRLKEQGYIQYDPSIKVYNNGVVEQRNKKVNLQIAAQKNLIGIGVKGYSIFGRNVSFDPWAIGMSETGIGPFSKRIIFKAYWDFDIMAYIIEKLANGESFK